ncbi:uncharacterized protein VTP21DRAFT_3081 [Calcarisporiella thermophila]|uniref:uncharacterized protein n=1 Tax=Calcarisporiella thermophila TaxID=911321 RepID=UPI003743A358
MLENIYIVRHGHRADWEMNAVEGVSWISPTRLSYDPPLSSFGLQQASELGAFMSDKCLDLIYCSPFSRCIQTASAVAQASKRELDVKLEYGIREWFGAEEKYNSYTIPTVESLHALFPLVDPTHKPLETTTHLCETISQCHDRFEAYLRDLVALLDASPTRNILLCTHAAGVIAAGRALIGNRNAYINSGLASVCKFVRREDGGWAMQWNGKTDFLSGGECRPWMFSTDYDSKT